MYIAAGEALAKAQDSTYEAVITSKIFQPLRMTASNFSFTAMQQSANFAYGYTNDPKLERWQMRLPVSIAAAGGIISNAKDMGEWLRLLLGAGMIDGKRLLSETGFQAMLSEQIEVASDTSYCLGLYRMECEDWQGHPIYYHRGNITGFNAEFYIIPDQKLGFAILTNVRISGLPRATLKIVVANLGTIP